MMEDLVMLAPTKRKIKKSDQTAIDNKARGF
jgi:hypothetical protein